MNANDNAEETSNRKSYFNISLCSLFALIGIHINNEGTTGYVALRNIWT